MRPATPDEIIDWDQLIVQNPSGGDLFQGKVFAAAKKEQGWEPQYMV
jgi:serine/alanine adding enzyme